MQHGVQAPTDERKCDTVGPARTSRRRMATLILLAVLVSLLGWKILYEPEPVDAAYEWTLHFPGTPPGATFNTKPGDDIRRMLDILRADTGADWQTPLAAQGTIEIRLSYHEVPSFWRQLSWGLRAPKGSLGPDTIVVLLSTLRVDEVSSEPLRYKVTHRRTGGDETITGTYDSYNRAEQAVLDELATVMDNLQENKGL